MKQNNGNLLPGSARSTILEIQKDMDQLTKLSTGTVGNIGVTVRYNSRKISDGGDSAHNSLDMYIEEHKTTKECKTGARKKVFNRSHIKSEVIK